MANCSDCLECVKMFGKGKTIFFCDVDEDIADIKFEKDHDCKSYNKDE